MCVMLCRESEQLGLTVLRTWAFADGPQWNAIQPSLGQLDERVLSKVGRSRPDAADRAVGIKKAGQGSRAEGIGSAGGMRGHVHRRCRRRVAM